MIREMSAEALQAQCRKCIRVEVSGIRALARLWSVWRGIREVAENLAEKMQTETNTLLCLSTDSRAVRALASEINAQLQALRRFRTFPLTVSFNAHPLVLVTVFHIAVPPIPDVQYWGYIASPHGCFLYFFISYPRFSSDDGVYASDDPARHVNASRALTQECSPSPHPIRARQTPF